MSSLQLTYGSQPVNGQLVPELTQAQIYPSQAYVPYAQGRGAYTPTLPPPVVIGPGSTDPWTSGIASSSRVNDAMEDPFNPQVSPVLWAVGFLIVGVLGLRFVHWRG